MLKNFVKFLGGDPNKRTINKLAQVADEINSYEPQFEKLSDEALRAKTDAFRRRLAKGETLEDILPEAFATVREASKRTIGLRHYDVQMLGGMVLGLLESFAASYLSIFTQGAFGAEYKDIFAFAILILILIFRPSGLLGGKTTQKA